MGGRGRGEGGSRAKPGNQLVCNMSKTSNRKAGVFWYFVV